MRKLKLFLILFIISKSVFSNEAVVIVLQAPLLKEPRFNSTVLQYKRNAEHVYIPNDVARRYPLPEFIETYDRTGSVVYIPSKFIKLITNDENEKRTSISYQGEDPTDYRLAEPIPKSYPFTEYSYLKASFSVSIGNNLKDPYTFNSPINSQSYSAETGGRFLISKRMDFDKYDRFYYGIIVNISSVTNNFELNNGQMLEAENRSAFKVGPILVYDSFKNEKYRVSMGTGFTYNYYRTLIKVAVRPSLTSSYVESETRFFNGYSLSPFITTFAQAENIIPDVDLILGTDISLNLKHTLRASGPATYSNYWNSDEIAGNTKPQAMMFLGFQVKY